MRNKYFKKALCRRLLVFVLGLLAFLGVSFSAVSNTISLVMLLFSLLIIVWGLSCVLFLWDDYKTYRMIVEAVKGKNLHDKVYYLLSKEYRWRSYLPFCEIWELRDILHYIQSKVLKQDDPQIQYLKTDLLKYINKRKKEGS